MGTLLPLLCVVERVFDLSVSQSVSQSYFNETNCSLPLFWLYYPILIGHVLQLFFYILFGQPRTNCNQQRAITTLFALGTGFDMLR